MSSHGQKADIASAESSHNVQARLTPEVTHRDVELIGDGRRLTASWVPTVCTMGKMTMAPTV